MALEGYRGLSSVPRRRHHPQPRQGRRDPLWRSWHAPTYRDRYRLDLLRRNSSKDHVNLALAAPTSGLPALPHSRPGGRRGRQQRSSPWSGDPPTDANGLRQHRSRGPLVTAFS